MVYKIKLSAPSEKQFLCEFSDGTNTYYIKFANAEEYKERLSGLLETDVAKLTLAQDFELPASLAAKGFKELIADVTKALDKNTITLSSEQSKQRNVVCYTYRDVDKFKHYWQGHTPYALFTALSEDIIEIPYADAPGDSEYRYGKTAYHTNHGTNHAVRQYILTKNYFDFLKREGKPEIKETANQLSLEEKSCIELASFLFRSGRTNELSWTDDNTYGKRSEEIFRQIAKELGYNESLIDLIAQSYDYNNELNVTMSLPEQTMDVTRKKAELFRTLLKLSHESDLVRCEINSAKTQTMVEKTLLEVLPEGSEPAPIANSFLDFAADLCRNTGAKIVSPSHQHGGGITGNSKLETETTQDVANTCRKLNALRPSIHPKCTAPTQVWFESPEHTYKEEEEIKIWGYDKEGRKIVSTLGWDAAQIRSIPTEACVREELEHIDEYVSVYHATTKASRALELLCRALASEEEKSITWHRTAPQMPRGSTQTDIDVMKSRSHQEIDNKSYAAWHLLSCNPTLWHNADHDSQESTVDYFITNISVTKLDFTDLINELLDQRQLLVGQHELRREFIGKFNTLINDEKYGTKGFIYQYQIPHHLVDEVAYISKVNGTLDPDNPSALDTLYALKTPGATVPNQDTLQVRLLVPKLMELGIAAHLKVTAHSGMESALEHEFSQVIDQLAVEAKTGPSDVVVAEKEEAKRVAPESVLSAYTGTGLTFFPTTRPGLAPGAAPAAIQPDDGELDPFSLMG